jgi:hypothetical protein
MFLRGYRPMGGQARAVRRRAELSMPERARSTTFRRAFAADLLQVQQRAVGGAIFDCGRGRPRVPVSVVSSNFDAIKFGSH